MSERLPKAEEMLWRMPELVERILVLLDPTSSLSLLRTSLVEKQVLLETRSLVSDLYSTQINITA